MTNLEEILDNDYKPASKKRPSHPTGMDQGIEFDPSKGNGTVTMHTAAGEPQQADWNKLVEDAGFPQLSGANYEIVRISGWNQGDGDGGVRWMQAFRARVTGKGEDLVDIEDLKKYIKKGAKPKALAAGKEAFVLLLSVWQIGKSEGGGSAATVERVTQVIANSKARIKQLRKNGHDIGKIAI